MNTLVVWTPGRFANCFVKFAGKYVLFKDEKPSSCISKPEIFRAHWASRDGPAAMVSRNAFSAMDSET